jgi:hypothetical protein
MRSVVFLASLLVANPLAVIAGETAPVQHAQMSARSHADCFCRAEGRMFAYGESACLRTPEGPRMAQCLMELNVTSWTLTSQLCPES